jgi:flagellar basal-body rod protein FlgB
MIEATSPIMTKALDGLFMRQTVTAQNIANAGSLRYTPLRVRFEEALRSAAAQDHSVASVMPQIVSGSASMAGGEMRLDLELQTSAETTMRYNALISVADHQLRLLSIAITGGA